MNQTILLLLALLGVTIESPADSKNNAASTVRIYPYKSFTENLWLSIEKDPHHVEYPTNVQ